MPRRPCATSTLRTLGLDLSITATGIVGWDGDKVLYAATAGTDAKEQRSQEERYAIVGAVVMEAVAKVRPHLAMIEAYAWSRGGKGQIVQLAELGGIVKFLLWAEEVPFDDTLQANSLKLYATGFGDAGKNLMLSVARRKYWAECPNHNTADALHLARYAFEHYEEMTFETTDSDDTASASSSVRKSARRHTKASP